MCWGVALVTAYRIYTLVEGDRYTRASDVDCPHDEAAILCAWRLADGDGFEMEVWERDRFIGRIGGISACDNPPRRHPLAAGR